MLRALTVENVKIRGRRYLARKRKTRSVRLLHGLATFIQNAYENDEWDMRANGETALLGRLAPARLATVFDVGSHVGDWALEALRSWPGSHVHAFEVASPTFERLTRNIAAGGFSAQVTPNCIGLSDGSTRREMFYFEDHPNLTCDMMRHPYAATPFTAELVAGDAYVREHGIDTIDFMKIDVEGAEHLVLKGFRQTLEAERILCIQFEYGAFSIQTRVLLADYYELLCPLYWIGKIFPTHVEFRDYDWTMESFRFSNFLCVSRRRPDLKALASTIQLS